MSKTRDTGFLGNVVKVDSNGNITFVNGSTTLATINTSGQFSGSSSVLSALSSSYSVNSDNLGGLGSTSFTTTSSFSSVSSSISGRVKAIEDQYSTTGSNTFTGTQNITNTTAPNGFSDTTAALYTAGGMQVTKDVYFSSSLYIKGDLTVYGTQSISYITSSQLNISDNIISVNTATPAVRFGGIEVYDSGSTGLTGSLLWDSQNNKWIYSNPSGSSYDGGMLMMGPRNNSGLGSEQGTTNNALMKGQGGDHITSSLITEDGNLMSVYSTLYVSSSGNVGVGTSSPSYPLTINSNTTQTSIGLMSGYSNSGARNWGIATNALAYGDFNLAQSSASGSDPFSGTSRLYITQAGNTTLTSGAGSTLTLVKTSNNVPALTFRGATYDSGIDGGDYMAFATSGSYRMYISSSGNIGMGTTTPGYNLDIQGTEAKIQIKSTATGGGTFVLASTYNAWSAGGEKFVITTDGGTAGIKFAISSSGNIGIGTYSPSSISGYTVVGINGSTGGLIELLSNTTAKGQIYAYQGLNIDSKGNTPIFFHVNDAEAIRINPSTNSGQAGHLLIGTTTDYNIWPSWDGGVIRIGQGGAMWHYRDSILDFMISSNYYIRSSDAQETRMGAGGAANIYMNNGNILLRTGASGTAGSSISWQNALNLTNAGDAVFGYATQQQGLWTAINTGYTTGNGSFQFAVGVGDEGGGGNIFKVEAGFAHYSGMGYNCLAEFYISTRGTGYEITDVKRSDSANAGSFTAWKSDNSTLVVAKNAGTYAGGGRYWIRVTKVTY